MTARRGGLRASVRRNHGERASVAVNLTVTHPAGRPLAASGGPKVRDTRDVEAPRPDADAVRAALTRILASDMFASTGRMSRLLRFVVERTLDGHGDEIKEYVLGTEVFDRGADYDPRLDSIVRVEVRRLRTKLDEYYAGPGSGDPLVIRIRRGTYVPEFDVRPPAPAAPVAPGAPTVDPPAAMAAPASAAAPGGREPSGGRTLFWIGGMLTLLAAAIVMVQVARSPGPALADSTRPRLAVLPFAHLTPEDGQPAVARRVTDDITTMIVGLHEGLEIVPRASAGQFTAEPRVVRDVARALNADWLVEGTVRHQGATLVVEVRLIDAARDRKTWVERFYAAPEGLDDLTREIAAGIVAAAVGR